MNHTLGAVAGQPFSVWAPAAASVTLVSDGRRSALRSLAFGWWLADLVAQPGTHYQYRIDDGPPLADPRSAFQPDGVHGPSEVVDHRAFAWDDADFVPRAMGDAVIYELHVGTFSRGGRFVDAIEHLPSLADLGVTHIEIMPVAAFPGHHGWGYDGVNLFAPHAPYGTPDELRSLVAAAHRIGLAVILDVVYNHLGPEGNHLASFGPYFTDAHHTPWGPAVNLDGPGSDEVRAFVIDNARQWLRDYHFDGLRLDAVHELRDDSAVHLLEALALAVDDLGEETGRRRVLIAESDRNDPRLVADRPGGLGLAAVWADDLHHALHVALSGERDGYYADFDGLADVPRALRHGWAYDGRYSTVRQRTIGRPVHDFPLGHRPADRLVTALDNHDQVGNRADGARTHQQVGVDLALVGATLALTAPTVPLLFQGEEWAASSPFLFFADHTDPDMVAAVRAGRFEEFAAFGWDASAVADPEDPASFARSKLVWSERAEPDHARTLAAYRALLALRRTEPALHSGLFVDDVSVDRETATIIVRRGDIIIAANLGPNPVLAAAPVTGLLFATSGHPPVDRGGVTIPPASAAVLRVGGSTLDEPVSGTVRL